MIDSTEQGGYVPNSLICECENSTRLSNFFVLFCFVFFCFFVFLIILSYSLATDFIDEEKN